MQVVVFLLFIDTLAVSLHQHLHQSLGSQPADALESVAFAVLYEWNLSHTAINGPATVKVDQSKFISILGFLASNQYEIHSL